MIKSPLLILGCGRSGTTWLSDIISKYTGRIILFEPCHPSLYIGLSDIIYQNDYNADQLEGHLINAIGKKIRDPWLLRNHLPSSIERVDSLYVDQVWNNCEIGGLKSIRLNTHFLDLINRLDANILYIIRHPLAVISSLLNRPRFWDDLGFETHWQLLGSSTSDMRLTQVMFNCDDLISKYAYIWAYLNMRANDQLSSIGEDPVFYEDLYLRPYETARSILTKINCYQHPIHPSHLFTPSLLSLNTIHARQYSCLHQDKEDLDFFWEKTLNQTQIQKINSIISTICDINPAFKELCIARSYI